MTDIGERIKSIRQENGYSQSELGDLLGVSANTVSRWETGKALPPLDICVAIGKVFSVSMDFLINDTKPCQEEDQISIRKGPYKRRIIMLLIPFLIIGLLTGFYFYRIRISSGDMIHQRSQSRYDGASVGSSFDKRQVIVESGDDRTRISKWEYDAD